jgi:hypothetical protein
MLRSTVLPRVLAITMGGVSAAMASATAMELKESSEVVRPETGGICGSQSCYDYFEYICVNQKCGNCGFGGAWCNYPGYNC